MEEKKPKPKYKRIVLKLSGEALRNTKDGEPIDSNILKSICEEVKEVSNIGVEIGLVIGGGNIFRGLNGSQNKGENRGITNVRAHTCYGACRYAKSWESRSDGGVRGLK